jgi:lactoylglutathione lyase
MARAVGINHIALEVGSLDDALAFYGRLFDVELRGRGPGMAFVDLGDQFIAFAQGRSQEPDRARHFGLVVDDRDAVLAAAREAGVEIFGGNSFLDPWGNHVQVVGYEDIQFTKTPEILRGMGLDLQKTQAAQQELRDKGLSDA